MVLGAWDRGFDQVHYVGSGVCHYIAGLLPPVELNR